MGYFWCCWRRIITQGRSCFYRRGSAKKKLFWYLAMLQSLRSAETHLWGAEAEPARCCLHKGQVPVSSWELELPLTAHPAVPQAQGSSVPCYSDSTECPAQSASGHACGTDSAKPWENCGHCKLWHTAYSSGKAAGDIRYLFGGENLSFQPQKSQASWSVGNCRGKHLSSPAAERSEPQKGPEQELTNSQQFSETSVL